MGRFAARLAAMLLKGSRLTEEDRNLLTSSVLDTLGALPLRDIIRFNENGDILVNDVPLQSEDARRLRMAARSLLDNPARELVYGQMVFTAIKHGIHNAETERQVLWGRAAIWWGQRERELLMALAGDGNAGQ